MNDYQIQQVLIDKKDQLLKFAGFFVQNKVIVNSIEFQRSLRDEWQDNLHIQIINLSNSK